MTPLGWFLTAARMRPDAKIDESEPYTRVAKKPGVGLFILE